MGVWGTNALGLKIATTEQKHFPLKYMFQNKIFIMGGLYINTK